MSSTLLPFLYQTRTLQRVVRSSKLPLRFSRWQHSDRDFNRHTSVPFEFDEDFSPNEIEDQSSQPSTITPSEREIFKSIFDEIATGNLPTPRKGLPHTSASITPGEEEDGGDALENILRGQLTSDGEARSRSMVEQARIKEFRDKTLQRFPSSLREAAQVALGQYSSEPGDELGEDEQELTGASRQIWEQKALFARLRSEEQKRVELRMRNCNHDQHLWQLMEDEVFSLPSKLGLTSAKKTKPAKKGKMKGKKAKKVEEEPESILDGVPDAYSMDVYGPLYAQFINTGLEHFIHNFKRPSPYAFNILPRIKELGLPSYVLGVSTTFFSRLAWVHWTQFGDPRAVLDVLEEMFAAGLYADETITALLKRIREEVGACSWGAQGPFVMAMMEAPPYDGALMRKLSEMEMYARRGVNWQRRNNLI